VKNPVTAALGASLVEAWPDAVLIADASGVIEYVNPAFERLTGYRSRDVVGRTPGVLKSGKQDARFYRHLWSRLRRGKPYRGVFLNRRKDGALFYEEELIQPVRAADGRVAHFLCAGRDVSVHMRQLRRVQRAATHDALTGLPNRALYADRLAQALGQAERSGEVVLVALLDLDDFRRINTRFGHAGGDAVLQAVAARTRRCLRAIDTVARIGGDEFALLLPAVRTAADAGKVLEKVRAANSVEVRHARRPIAVSVTIGAAVYPRDGRAEATLLERADRAMYVAKRAGGNRWRFAGTRGTQ
jgi:diguanylate cyclase (GGDEF)-like protein/PAS domain S-box-containing protein